MAEINNTVALQAVAHGLGDLLAETVFVGGATVGLHASRPAAPGSRPTDDVDCIVELASYGAFAALEDRLRARGFRNDAESGVQVRWRYQGLQVDVMPTEPRILGFSNPLGPCWNGHGATARAARRNGDSHSAPCVFFGHQVLRHAEPGHRPAAQQRLGKH